MKIEYNPAPQPIDLAVWIYSFFVPLRNWWNGAFSRRKAFQEGASLAFDCAAMQAYDAGYPEVRDQINEVKKRFLS